jgi:PPM family protein phosphatase
MTVLRSGSATDVGRVRTINQDMPLERPNLFAVADGMGGHVGGEVASRVAVETLEHAFERAPSVDGLRDAFAQANRAVWQESQKNADLRGMGTTLTAMALVGLADHDVLALANVGDSRAYIYSDGGIVQITADHSLAEERMRHGEMTEAEAAVHPQRHILTRALGVSSDVETDMWQLELRSGDRVLLCSDGLSNEVSTDEMAEILGAVDDPTDAAKRLVQAANEHGGADNITVVIVDVQVGEEDASGETRVMPLGLRGAPVTVPASAAADVAAASTAATPATPGRSPDTGSPGSGGPGSESEAMMRAAVASTATQRPFRMDDTLVPGSRLSFGDEPATLAESGPRSDEFFLGSGPEPVARATTRVPPPPPPEVKPAKESRAERRRRLGVPRRVTFRVIGFVLLVAAVPIAAYYVLRWYAYDNYIVTTHGDQVVVVQGQPGGVLWFHPRIVDRTGVTTDRLAPDAVAPIKAGVSEASLRKAQQYIASVTTTSTTTTTTTTTPAPGGAGQSTSTSGP